MLALAIGAFSFSLIGLMVLFFLKYFEAKRGTMYAPELRSRGDHFARTLKATARFALARVEQLPSDALVLSRRGVHFGAVFFARGARAAESAAHALADRVSHKHHFERGESHSAFLKSVTEHKNGLPGPTP